MYKVRFNLGKGSNYRKWKITDDYETRYLDPAKVTLILRECRLYNNKTTAKKIHAGANKSVCAWVECEDVTVLSAKPIYGNLEEVLYNPRIKPHWIYKGRNGDGQFIESIVSNSNKLYEL